MGRIESLVSHIEKTADAMARAYRRGDLKKSLGTPEDPHSGDVFDRINFDRKIQKLEPRASGHSTMLTPGDKTFASGAEGYVDLGAKRGYGLTIKKTFTDSAEHAGFDFADYATRNVGNRFRVMDSNNRIFPDVIRGMQDHIKPSTGWMEMEYVHGIPMSHVADKHKGKLMGDLHDELVSDGWHKDTQNPRAYFHPKSGYYMMDLHENNILYDANLGKARIVDPMVVHEGEPMMMATFRRLGKLFRK